MANGVASNNGNGVFDWPGRRMLGSAELSSAELREIARHPEAHPAAQKAARIAWGNRIKAKRIRFFNRIWNGRTR